MQVAETVVLGTIEDDQAETCQITATLEAMEGVARWILRVDGQDAQTGTHDTIRQAVQSAIDSWGSGSWNLTLSDAGMEIMAE